MQQNACILEFVRHVYLCKSRVWVREMKITEAKYHSHDIISRAHTVNKIGRLTLTLIIWLRQCVCQLFHCKVTLYPLFHTLLLGKKSQNLHKFLKFSKWNICFFSPIQLFVSYLFILVCTPGYLFYTLDNNSILPYQFCYLGKFLFYFLVYSISLISSTI